jgi:opacity protein-like surface antigen
MVCYRNNILFFCFLFTLFSLPLTKGLNAQSSLNYRWYVNANGGISQMYGDIQQSNSPIGKLSDETTFGFGARLGKYLGPVFSIHLQYYDSDFKGYDTDSDQESSTDLMEYQLGTTVNFSNLFFSKKERIVSVYGTFGVGAAFFRSEFRKISNGEILNQYGYEDDPSLSKKKKESGLAFPIGAGIDFKLADRLYMNLESVIRFNNTDKLDAKVAGTDNDAYYYTSLGISYNFFGKKSKQLIESPPELADPFANETVDLLYDIPKNLKSNDAFVLKSIIHKGKINGPGRLIQILPIGLEVLDTLIAGARTQCINYTLYLNWDELPADSVFEVSYRVKPDKIYGSLPMVSNLYLQRTGKEYKFRTYLSIEQVEEEIILPEPVVEVVKKDTVFEKPDIEYRVQITAGYKSKIPIETLAARFKLNVEFREDCITNWCHYSVGSFETYEQAREYKNLLMSEHGARDAFIVAFYKGKRMNQLSELKEIEAPAHPIKTVYKEGGYCYRVQILAILNKSVDPESLREMHKIEEEVNEEVYHNWRKYTVGKCASIGEAKLLLNKIKDKGITDAFIVIYKNGERVLSTNQ